MAYGDGLENRCGVIPTGGSNPSSSADKGPYFYGAGLLFMSVFWNLPGLIPGSIGRFERRSNAMIAEEGNRTLNPSFTKAVLYR